MQAITVREAVESCLEDKHGEGITPRSLQSLRSVLLRFAGRHGDRQFADITHSGSERVRGWHECGPQDPSGLPDRHSHPLFMGNPEGPCRVESGRCRHAGPGHAQENHAGQAGAPKGAGPGRGGLQGIAGLDQGA